MLTVNLEKELIRQNKRIQTPQELLLIREYERLDKGEDVAPTLSRVGLGKAYSGGKRVVNRLNSNKEATSRFNQDRVFHISQIKSLCLKYYLRFLPTIYYKGSVDEDVHLKVTNFELAYGVNMNEGNSMIIAPKEAFNLEERPKDPLLFYRINNEYFYLVAKWGNDLSIKNRVKALLSGWFTVLWVTLGIDVLLAIGVSLTENKVIGTICIAFLMGSIFPILMALLANVPERDHYKRWGSVNFDGLYFFKPNFWDSKFED